MKNSEARHVYAHSATRDYMENEYVDLFKKKNAVLHKGTASALKRFMADNAKIQVDTETNVTEHYTKRTLNVVQLGTYYGEEQHIIDMEDCTPEIFEILREFFRSSKAQFIIHNGKFEYLILLRVFGVCIDNIKDTMLASRLITAGLDTPMGYNGLASLLKIRFGIDVSKAAQTTFDGTKMSPEQLLYADTDVIYLGRLLDELIVPMRKWKLMRVFDLENKSIRPIGDMTANGVLIDKEALEENIIAYDQAAAEAKAAMVKAFQEDTGKGVQEKIAELNVVQKEDEVIINWNSSVQKKLIINHLYPDIHITSSAKGNLLKLVDIVENPEVLNKLLNGDTEDLELLLISRHRQFLADSGLFIAKGNLNLNFNSPAQLLEFFRIWYPQIQGVGVKALKKLKHPIIKAYQRYSKANKLVSSFGRKMYDYIEDEDGCIHAGFNQLVPTGSRMSSSKPNIQQAPSTEQYRRMFIPRPGYKFIDSDYSSAELFLAAYLSGDKNMLYAVENGYDLHSYSSYLIFGQEWIDAGGSATPVGKPATKEANKFRKASKSLSFSLLYGTGVQSFSENLGIPVAEGKSLMARYFATFPQLAAFFKKSGEDALTYNYVREPYFGRVRFFNKPKNGMEASHNKNAGMNYKPQAANGSIMKYALCLMKKYIEENDLEDKVRLIFTVHDQQLSEVRDDFVNEWQILQTKLMEKAALFAIPSGALKAESDVLEHWTKG